MVPKQNCELHGGIDLLVAHHGLLSLLVHSSLFLVADDIFLLPDGRDHIPNKAQNVLPLVDAEPDEGVLQEIAKYNGINILSYQLACR